MSGAAARWIRLGRVDALTLHASYAGLAGAQALSAAPLVLWGQAKTHLCLGRSQGLAELDAGVSVPVAGRPRGGGLVWVDEHQYLFVLIAPRRHAPGRPARWFSWALGPVIATYRQFGLHAYLNEQDLWLEGRKIAGSGAATIGECAVVASSFLLRFPGAQLADSVASPSPGFRQWLREGPSLAVTEWAEHGEVPSGRDLEATFMGRIAAHYGWRFENSWPSATEAVAIEAARVELEEPIKADLPRGASGGVKLNARGSRVEHRRGAQRARALTVERGVRRRVEK